MALTETVQTQLVEQGSSSPDPDVRMCRHSHLHVPRGPHRPGLQLTPVPGQPEATAGRLHLPDSGRGSHGHHWNLGLTSLHSPQMGLSLPVERFRQALSHDCSKGRSMVLSTTPPAFKQTEGAFLRILRPSRMHLLQGNCLLSSVAGSMADSGTAKASRGCSCARSVTL